MESVEINYASEIDQGLYDMNWDLPDSSLSNKHPVSHEYSFHPSQILNL